MGRKWWVAATFLIVLSALTGRAVADRNVWVNGFRMSAGQIALLERENCGVYIPDGSYWLNLQTGAWGYMHEFPAASGNIKDNCGQTRKRSEPNWFKHQPSDWFRYRYRGN